MRCKNIAFSLVFVLLWAAVFSMAADYNILVKDERSNTPATRLYVILEKTVDGVSSSSRCTQLTRDRNGSFSVKATMDAATEPTLTFYTGGTCRASTAIGSISPLASAEPVESDFTITIGKNKVVTQANGIDSTSTTTPGNDGPGTQTPGNDGPGTQTPNRPTQQTKRPKVRSKSISSRLSDPNTSQTIITPPRHNLSNKALCFRLMQPLPKPIPSGSRLARKSGPQQQFTPSTRAF